VNSSQLNYNKFTWCFHKQNYYILSPCKHTKNLLSQLVLYYLHWDVPSTEVPCLRIGSFTKMLGVFAKAKQSSLFRHANIKATSYFIFCCRFLPEERQSVDVSDAEIEDAASSNTSSTISIHMLFESNSTISVNSALNVDKDSSRSVVESLSNLSASHSNVST
jgi:hypothetical protein